MADRSDFLDASNEFDTGAGFEDGTPQLSSLGTLHGRIQLVAVG